MAYPVYIFDSPDGTGKTTQSLLLAKFLREKPFIPAVYASLLSIGLRLARQLVVVSAGGARKKKSAYRRQKTWLFCFLLIAWRFFRV